MIAIFRRTPAGVVRVATASTRAEALAALSGIRAPAVAFAGGDPVGATGYTSTADRDAIIAHVAPARTPDTEPCVWPACCEPAAREHGNTQRGLVDLCAGHRRMVYENSRPLDTSSPRAVRALMTAVGPLHCTERRCAKCRAAIRTCAAALTARAT